MLHYFGIFKVFEERQNQVQEKMAAVRLDQEESVQRREELLQEMEMAQQMTERDKAAQREAITHRKRELEAQVYIHKHVLQTL